MERRHETTLLSLLAERAALDRDKPAVYVKRAGVYRWRTWGEVARDVRRAAAVLRRLGAEPGDRVIQVSENRYEWIVCDLAIQLVGAVHAPVHAQCAGPQLARCINHSGARLVLVSDQLQWDKLACCRDQLAGAPRFLAFDPCQAPAGPAPPDVLADQVAGVTEAEAA
jgi:long-chain acyl-CoA synthetase